jgi:hypothetical protein
MIPPNKFEPSWRMRPVTVGADSDRTWEALVIAVKDGILRFLNRPENNWLLCSFTRNQAWQVHQQQIDEMLFEEMDALPWIIGGGFLGGDDDLVVRMAEALWEDALYQVITELCISE